MDPVTIGLLAAAGIGALALAGGKKTPPYTLTLAELAWVTPLRSPPRWTLPTGSPSVSKTTGISRDFGGTLQPESALLSPGTIENFSAGCANQQVDPLAFAAICDLLLNRPVQEAYSSAEAIALTSRDDQKNWRGQVASLLLIAQGKRLDSIVGACLTVLAEIDAAHNLLVASANSTPGASSLVASGLLKLPDIWSAGPAKFCCDVLDPAGLTPAVRGAALYAWVRTTPQQWRPATGGAPDPTCPAAKLAATLDPRRTPILWMMLCGDVTAEAAASSPVNQTGPLRQVLLRGASNYRQPRPPARPPTGPAFGGDPHSRPPVRRPVPPIPSGQPTPIGPPPSAAAAAATARAAQIGAAIGPDGYARLPVRSNDGGLYQVTQRVAPGHNWRDFLPLNPSVANRQGYALYAGDVLTLPPQWGYGYLPSARPGIVRIVGPTGLVASPIPIMPSGMPAVPPVPAVPAPLPTTNAPSEVPNFEPSPPPLPTTADDPAAPAADAPAAADDAASSDTGLDTELVWVDESMQ